MMNRINVTNNEEIKEREAEHFEDLLENEDYSNESIEDRFN